MEPNYTANIGCYGQSPYYFQPNMHRTKLPKTLMQTISLNSPGYIPPKNYNKFYSNLDANLKHYSRKLGANSNQPHVVTTTKKTVKSSSKQCFQRKDKENSNCTFRDLRRAAHSKIIEDFKNSFDDMADFKKCYDTERQNKEKSKNLNKSGSKYIYFKEKSYKKGK